MQGETNLSGFFQPERLIPNIHCHAALARGSRQIINTNAG